MQRIFAKKNYKLLNYLGDYRGNLFRRRNCVSFRRRLRHFDEQCWVFVIVSIDDN